MCHLVPPSLAYETDGRGVFPEGRRRNAKRAGTSPAPTSISPDLRTAGGAGNRLPSPLLPRLRPLLRHPGLDVLLQQVERHGAVAQHVVVEGPDVEFRAQLPLRVGAQLLDLQLADLVGQRLPRRHNVAVDLDLDVVLG